MLSTGSYKIRKIAQKSFPRKVFKHFATKANLETTRPESTPSEKTLSTFSFADYDCIGFDLDCTLARFKHKPTIKLAYDALAKYMIDNKNYSPNHLLHKIDYNFCVRGLLIDDENGNILKLASDGTILRASHGTRILMKPEIQDYYPTRHWKIADVYIKDPLMTWESQYILKTYALLDIFESPASLVFARCVDMIDNINGEKKNYNIWPDMLEAVYHIYNTENFSKSGSYFYKTICEQPERYYEKCSKKLLCWLKQLKDRGKLLFLVTGSEKPFAEFTIKNTIGDNWKDIFDTVVYDARKPGFFTSRRPFVSVATNEGDSTAKTSHVSQLNIRGNYTDLCNFLSGKLQNKKTPKFLYVGDHLIQDIYAPNVYTQCDAVFVSDEMNTEGIFGFERQEENEDMSTFSFVWGSFFFDGNKETNWYSVMKKHAQICVPDMEYVASLPIDHKHERCHLKISPDDFD